MIGLTCDNTIILGPVSVSDPRVREELFKAGFVERDGVLFSPPAEAVAQHPELGEIVMAVDPAPVEFPDADPETAVTLPGGFALMPWIEEPAQPPEGMIQAGRETAIEDGRILTRATYRAAPGPPAPPSLDEVKARAMVAVDAEAERRRLLVITPGDGQAQEYQFTGDEAALAANTPDPLDPKAFPYLEAERKAQAAVHGDVTLRSVAEVVAGEASAWKAYGAAIKEARRTAKEQIEVATDAAEIMAILAGVAWPEVGA